MTASLHLAAGAAAGVAVQKYLFSDVGLAGKIFWAFVAGVASHVLFDMFPHQDYELNVFVLWTVVLAEAVLVLTLVLPLARSFTSGLILFSGVVGGALPDFLGVVHDNFFKHLWLANLGSFIHLYGHGIVPLPFKINFWWQSLVAVMLILFVRVKSV